MVDEWPFLERGLRVLIGELLAFVENADGNLRVPLEGFLESGIVTRRVVTLLILKLVHLLPKELVRVDLVIGHTWAEDIDEGESVMGDASGDQISQMLGLAGKSARDVRGAGNQRQCHGVD